MASIISLRKSPVTGPAVAGPGGGTTFTIDAAAQAATATVDGQEVVAPLRSGNGILAQVVPRSNTLAALLGTDGNAGELSYPSNASGVVQHTGVAGGARWLGNDEFYVINVNTDPTISMDVPNDTLVIPIPAGVRNVYLTTGSTSTPLASGRPTSFKLMLGGGPLSKETATAIYRIVLAFNVDAEVLAGRCQQFLTIGSSPYGDDPSIMVHLDPDSDTMNRDAFEVVVRTTTGTSAVSGGTLVSRRIGSISDTFGF